LNVTEKNIAVKINVRKYFELILRPLIFILAGDLSFLRTHKNSHYTHKIM